MAININYNITDKLLCVNTGHNNLDELGIIENFYFKISCKIFLNESTILVTKQPQEYSFGKGMEKSYNLKIDKSKVLINKVDKCENAFLKSLIQSEEFKRGLLILVKTNKDLLESDVKMILEATNYIKPRFNSLLTFIFCEDDGDSICLYNTGIDIDFLQSLRN
jgi:hypothetical protein